MGETFDRASQSLLIFGSALTVRAIIAERIIEVTKNGECDPGRLYEQALVACP
jgi:tartrate dehydratase beta subunit/fumarate hydratase class I family protein